MKASNAMVKACVVLEGRSMTASEIGSELWPNRTGRCGHSVNGGGDYAAQMLLGRMRKRGLVRTTRDPGSSRWKLTLAGHGLAELAARAARASKALMLTADTITDEQIRELRGRACDAGEVELWVVCDLALGGPPDALALQCPLCSAASGYPCRSVAHRASRDSIGVRPRKVRTHPDRILTRDAARAKCAEIINARRAPEGE